MQRMCEALNHIEQKSENVLFSFLVMCSTFLGGWGGLVGGRLVMALTLARSWVTMVPFRT